MVNGSGVVRRALQCLAKIVSSLIGVSRLQGAQSAQRPDLRMRFRSLWQRGIPGSELIPTTGIDEERSQAGMNFVGDEGAGRGVVQKLHGGIE